jgi:hypothetical protein
MTGGENSVPSRHSVEVFLSEVEGRLSVLNPVQVWENTSAEVAKESRYCFQALTGLWALTLLLHTSRPQRVWDFNWTAFANVRL